MWTGVRVGHRDGNVVLWFDDLEIDSTVEGAGDRAQKPPYRVREGGARLCFVRDPDDYRVELLELGA